MGFKCLTDNRNFQETDLSVYGSPMKDRSLIGDDDDYMNDEEFQYNTENKNYSFFCQHSRRNYINENDFLNYSKTGDILLY